MTRSNRRALLVFCGLGFFSCLAPRTGAAAVDERYITSVVSRCTVPRVAVRAFVPHSCRNAVPVAGQRYYDICTGKAGKVYDASDVAPSTDYDRIKRPEWDTARVAGGIGMLGVQPWGCSVIRGADADAPPLQLPTHLASAVAALHGWAGSPTEGLRDSIGSAVLVAPHILLTARHVLYKQGEKQKQRALSFAVFKYRNSDLYEPMSHENLLAAPLVLSGAVPKILFESEQFDFAFIEIDLTNVKSPPSPIPIPKYSANTGAEYYAGSPLVVGYTDNPFYPRGLVVSGRGTWHERPDGADEDETPYPSDIFYNVNTAHGFSGGGVFDSTNRWRGVHQRAYSASLPDKNDPRLRDFSRPNGGVSIERVFGELANQACDARLQAMFRDDQAAATIASYRSPSVVPPCGTSSMKNQAAAPVTAMSTPMANAHSETAKAPPNAACYVAKSTLAEWGCRADYRHPLAQNQLPDLWKRAWPAVGAIVAKDALNTDVLVGTGVLLAADLVLTAGHVAPIPSAIGLNQFRFVLGYLGEKKCQQSIDVATPILAASAQNLRDFALLRLKLPVDLTENAVECPWKMLAASPQPAALQGRSAVVVGHFVESDGDQAPLSLFYSGEFFGTKHWSKDGGGTANVDYALYVLPGASGGAVLDADFTWFALHQRSLRQARSETDSHWHPYGHWLYGETWWSAARETRCKPHDRIITIENSGSLLQCWPAQATLLTDIAEDIARTLGAKWVCERLPLWARLLPNIDEFSCDRRRRDNAKRWAAAGGGSN